MKKKLKINEIFKSIQGESSYIGLPCIFIRLTGCNLNCSYCDTDYAKKNGTFYNCDKIMKSIEKFECNLVEITGGEPLLQEGVYDLFKKLLKRKYTVLLETNGSISLKQIPKEVIKIMDIKCPDSDMSDKMNYENFKFLTHCDEIKFVIKSKKDYEWAKEKIHLYSLNKISHVIISPVWNEVSPAKISKWILRDNLPVRFQMQLHKIIGIS